MHTTNQILDLLSEKLGNASDYRLAKALRCASASTVGNWRKGRSSLNPTYAVRVADLLGWESAYVMACVESERAAKDARLEDTQEIVATWQKIADRFKPAAALVLLGALACLAHPEPAHAASNMLAPTVDYSTDLAASLYIIRTGKNWAAKALIRIQGQTRSRNSAGSPHQAA